MSEKRPADKLTVEDFRRHPIWKFTNTDDDETAVQPIDSVPAFELGGCLIGTIFVLHNNISVPGMLSNIDLRNANKTRHLIGLKVFHSDRVFHLAHYSEVDYLERSPDRLAEFLNLSVDDIFPIAYDISHLAVGDMSILKGVYPKEPERRLTEDEIFRLALE